MQNYPMGLTKKTTTSGKSNVENPQKTIPFSIMQVGKIYHDKDLGYIQYIGKRIVGKRTKDTFQTLGQYHSQIYLHKKELGALTEYTGKAIYTLTSSGKNKISITKTENK
jgi:hypothetical protein